MLTPNFTTEAIIDKQYLPKLEYLEIKAPMEALEAYRGFTLAAFSIGTFRHLRIPASYLCRYFEVPREWLAAKPYNLDTLELEYLDGRHNPQIRVDLIWDAVDEGPFKNLRRVRMDRRLIPTIVTDDVYDFEDFNQYLKALAREDGAGARYTEDEAGIRMF